MKKIYFLLISLVLLSVFLFGQEKSGPFINEFTISVNWSNPTDDFTKNNIGFGIGAYHPFFPKKTANLIVGMEYNRTSQFVEHVSTGPNINLYNYTFVLNNISLPIGLRINTGKKTVFFFETGGFADLLISSNENLSSCVGVYFGMGIRIPVSKIELIIKPEGKYGLNDLGYRIKLYTSYIRLSVGIKI